LMDLWEAIEVPEVVVAQAQVAQAQVAQAQTATQTAARESELLALIHDLNECNDTLLARVAQLENNLESTQSKLTATVANAQAAQDKMGQQVLSEQSSAQQVSHNAQQQVAKLVGKLEATEQALSRQQLINENLQTELSNSQERTTQLERECALTSQQHAEEAQARLQAETISRDLRSRLQRQQRYTLQFKAALEKSLTVNTRPANGLTNGLTVEATRPISFQDAFQGTDSVAMPKAQRITPWASAGVTAAFQGIDPHLETLIRGTHLPSEHPPSEHPPSEPNITRSRPPIEEAEATLWQDLERVMNAPEVLAESTTDSTTDSATDEVVTAEIATEIVTVEAIAEATEADSATLLNEGAAHKPADGANDTAANDRAAAIAQEKQEALALAESFAVAATRQSDPKVIFTEPSPWGSPLPKKMPERMPEGMSERAIAAQSAAQAATKIAAAQAAAQATTQTTIQTTIQATANPAYAALGTDASAVSPLVNPLRSPKKVGSLAAVELPTFPNAKVGSFKR
jgi:myosin heavy subunit